MAKDAKVNAKAKGSLVATVTNKLNKHGEIKGDNKKETKNLRAMCPHHKYNKKGKIKPTVYNDGNGTITCTMCNAKIPTHVLNSDELGKITGKFKTVLDQARYMAQASDLGNETQQFLARLSVDTAQFTKTYGKIRHVVERSENMKKKNKKNHNNASGSNNYGSWR